MTKMPARVRHGREDDVGIDREGPVKNCAAHTPGTWPDSSLAPWQSVLRPCVSSLTGAI